MSAFRAIASHSRPLTRTINGVSSNAHRAFHSPFAVLSTSSPLTSPPAPSSNAGPLYEKQHDHSPEPQLNPTGNRTYVVSAPDPSNTPYEVPSGAYPTSAPYQNYTRTEPPESRPRASTSPSFAHPTLTQNVPRNDSGVKESAAVRFREAPGELHQKGGSNGGLGLMDAKTTIPGKGELASRNPAPDRPEVAERFSALGNDKAWKERK